MLQKCVCKEQNTMTGSGLRTSGARVNVEKRDIRMFQNINSVGWFAFQMLRS